jgi:hypothetical protein
MNISIIIAQAEHFKYAQEIYTIELSALLRGMVQKRTPEYIQKRWKTKMQLLH